MAADVAIGAGLTLANTMYDSYWKQKQISENWDMMMYQNHWNSPEEQVKRLRAAGINPALALGNGALGSGLSQSSPPNISSHPLDHGSIMEGLRIDNESRLAASQSAKLDQETEAERIRNLFAMRRESQELHNLIASGNLTDAQKRRAQREADFLDQQIYWYGDITESNIRANQAKARLDDANSSLLEIEAKYKPHEWQKVLRNLDSQNESILAQVRVGNTQAALNIALKAVEESKKDGIVINNQLARDTADAYVDKAYSEALDAYWKSEQAGRNYLLGTELGGKVGAMDFNGHSYSSPKAQFDHRRPQRYSNVVRVPKVP